MQANHAMNPGRASFGSWAAGRSGMWLIVVFFALVAALASRVPPSTVFAGDVAPSPTGMLHDALPRTEGSASPDLSLPRASDVHFAPAGDEEAPATF